MEKEYNGICPVCKKGTIKYMGELQVDGWDIQILVWCSTCKKKFWIMI
jgi:hypothetical protein